MSIVASILAMLCAALALHGGLRLRAAERCAREAAATLRYDGLRLLEIQHLQAQQLRLSDAQRLTETVIDTGTEVARSVHMGIASVPFGVLEALPVTRDVSRAVRQTHDVIADAVYGSIRNVNRGIGQLARGLLKPPARDARTDND